MLNNLELKCGLTQALRYKNRCITIGESGWRADSKGVEKLYERNYIKTILFYWKLKGHVKNVLEGAQPLVLGALHFYCKKLMHFINTLFEMQMSLCKAMFPKRDRFLQKWYSRSCVQHETCITYLNYALMNCKVVPKCITIVYIKTCAHKYERPIHEVLFHCQSVCIVKQYVLFTFSCNGFVWFKWAPLFNSNWNLKKKSIFSNVSLFKNYVLSWFLWEVSMWEDTRQRCYI